MRGAAASAALISVFHDEAVLVRQGEGYVPDVMAALVIYQMRLQELGELYEAGLRLADALRKHHVTQKPSDALDHGPPSGSPHP